MELGKSLNRQELSFFLNITYLALNISMEID